MIYEWTTLRIYDLFDVNIWSFTAYLQRFFGIFLLILSRIGIGNNLFAYRDRFITVVVFPHCSEAL